MRKKNTLESRKFDEMAEGETQVQTSVSGDKFQNDQQIVKPVKQSQDMTSTQNEFAYKHNSSKGSQLKQEAVAKVVTGVGGSSATPTAVALSGSGTRSLAYSGAEGTILGSASGTPVVDRPSRSETRPGQKMDAITKAIDFAASEQVLQEYDGSKPLQDNPTEVQGYLGHPENDSARGQKMSEAVPGALLFQRSADELANDQIVFAAGQMVREQGVEYAIEPTTYRDDNNDQKPFRARKGNYIPKALRIGINSTTRQIVSMTYDVDDVSVENETYDVVNESATHLVTDMNNAEINRQNMETKAGVETEKNWCPLVRAVDHPTQTVGFLTDDEVITGSENFMAYRFFMKAWGYLMNKVGKDGQVPYRTFREMLFGYARSYNDSNQISDVEPAFNAVDYLNGAPSLMIALYDSINKYSKRGDLFTQPRGWKMHKQTADNNINQFRIKPEFAAYIAATDVFSTIDRGYDPLLPSCITDGWRVAYPYNWNDLFNRHGGTKYITRMKGKGATTAGEAMDAFIDDINTEASWKAHTFAEAGILKGYNTTAQTYTSLSYYDSIYSASRDDSRKPIKTYTGFVAADLSTKAKAKNGYETYAEGLAAAEGYLAEILASDPMHYRNCVIGVLFKVDDNVDDVYTLIYAPNCYATVNTVAFWVAHSTTADYLTTDVTVTANVATSLAVTDQPTFAYSYHNRQNSYLVAVKNPLLYGVAEWAEGMALKLATAAVTSGTANVATASQASTHDGIIWYYIPIAHYTRQMSLWDMIVCASVPFQQKVRTNSQFDTLNYVAANGEYPYVQLKDLGSMNPLASVNYTLNGLEKPLVIGTMKPSAAIKWIAPEKFWRVRHADTANVVTDESFVLPYYFSEEQFEFNFGDGTTDVVKDVEGHVMNFPTVRSGARWAYTDQFFGMTERDIRLCLDRLTRIPGGNQTGKNSAKVGVYKYSTSNSGIPVVNYTAGGMLTARLLLCTPREIGWGMIAPLGYVTPATNEWYLDSSGQHTYHVSCDNNSYSIDKFISEGSSFRLRAWRVQSDADYPAINATANVVVNRAGNFAQRWKEQGDAIYVPYGQNANYLDYGTLLYFYPMPDIGIAISFADAVSIDNGAIVGNEGDSLFAPFTTGQNGRTNNIADVLTLQKLFWTKIQQLPFALSPFDQTPASQYISEANVVVDALVDPYDLMYIFGFCGFKASDFREDVFNRIYEKQTLGWQFKHDPFVTASPVLKDGGLTN